MSGPRGWDLFPVYPDEPTQQEVQIVSAVDFPEAPTVLTAVADGSDRINLAWTDNAQNESGFKIERSPDGITFAQIALVNANIKTFPDSGLSPSTQFFYRVRAFNSAGNSIYSNTADDTTAPSGTGVVVDLPPPPLPPPVPPPPVIDTVYKQIRIFEFSFRLLTARFSFFTFAHGLGLTNIRLQHSVVSGIGIASGNTGLFNQDPAQLISRWSYRADQGVILFEQWLIADRLTVGPSAAVNNAVILLGGSLPNKIGGFASSPLTADGLTQNTATVSAWRDRANQRAGYVKNRMTFFEDQTLNYGTINTPGLPAGTVLALGL